MKTITVDDIKKMWIDAPERDSIIEFYCYKKGLKSDQISDEDKNKIYSELYSIESFIRDYYKDIFYYGKCEPDEEVSKIYEQIFIEELFEEGF